MELGGGGPQERDWKGIGTALLVIMLICSLIFLAGFLFTPLTAASDLLKAPLNLSDLGSLRSRVHGLKWVSNDKIYYETASGGVDMLDINTGETSKVIDTDALQSPTAKKLPSKDYTYFVVMTKAPNPGLNPMNATWFANIVHSKTQMMYKVGLTRKEEEAITLFAWNPVYNDYVFVQDGHIYYSSSPESKESIRVSKSSDGIKKIHGVFDWMYEEEIYGTKQALWWAPNGDKLAYASRDLRPSKEVTLTSYDRRASYPIDSQLVYPKTGEKRLPVYTISIWDRKTKHSKQLDVQLRDSLSFHYLFAVNWVVLEGKETVVAVWTNRYQNHISITLCDYDTSMCSLVAEHKYPAKMWASPRDFRDMLFSNDSIYCILPRQKSDGNSYQHVAKFQIRRDILNPSIRWSKPTFLYMGTYDVNNMVRLDEKNDVLYYTAHAPFPGNMHLFSTKASPSNTDESRCVSCFSQNCTNQEVGINNDYTQLHITCLGPAPKKIYLANMGEGIKNVTEILVDNQLASKLDTVQIPVVIEETIPLENGLEARVKLLIPSDQLSKSHSRSLPVLIKVYAGPGSQMVDDVFGIGFEEYLVSNKHFAVLKIDGRGSGMRGWNYKSPIYGALGSVEILDQIETARWMFRKYPYLDTNRVSVFGWSYGGFAAANMVEMAENRFFKCAVSVAPVSNFMFYDATYTERYMGNAGREAYNNADISRDVSKFKETKLLLMHGLFDDNVHFQNSAIFIEQLQMNNVDFELMVYPNQNHQMQARTKHVFQTIENFLTTCLSA